MNERDELAGTIAWAMFGNDPHADQAHGAALGRAVDAILAAGYRKPDGHLKEAAEFIAKSSAMSGRDAMELVEAVAKMIVPRTVTTATELDALPVGSVVLDGSGDTWQSYAGCERPDGTLRTYWECGEAVEASDDFAFPLTVLHEPTP